MRRKKRRRRRSRKRKSRKRKREEEEEKCIQSNYLSCQLLLCHCLFLANSHEITQSLNPKSLDIFWSPSLIVQNFNGSPARLLHFHTI
jgi:hypothetical protein